MSACSKSWPGIGRPAPRAEPPRGTSPQSRCSLSIGRRAHFWRRTIEILLIILVLALIFGGGFILRLIGLAVGIVVAIVGAAVILFFVVIFGILA